jgi:hypothetical protein
VIVEIGDMEFISRKDRLSDAKTALYFINSFIEEDAQISINKK